KHNPHAAFTDQFQYAVMSEPAQLVGAIRRQEEWKSLQVDYLERGRTTVSSVNIGLRIDFHFTRRDYWIGRNRIALPPITRWARCVRGVNAGLEHRGAPLRPNGPFLRESCFRLK